MTTELIKPPTKYVYRKPNCKIKFTPRELPWTIKQQKLIQLLQHRKTQCCFISGAAGTSKTLVAIYAGLQLLKDGKISDITYIRSAVESSSSKLGYLPGDITEKFQAYTTPLQEKLEELLDAGTIDALKKADVVKATPINYIRGLHASGRLLILDESQNFHYEELVTAITRIGEASRIWFLGDPKQTDLRIGQSGFVKFKDRLNDEECIAHGIHNFEFTKDDIVRSEFCKFVVDKLELD
jgi:phosphate starvation-inducible protein PhoH and related proteins